MSSDMEVPPKHAWAWTFSGLPKAKATRWVCSASSLVGDSIRTWGTLIPMSILCNAPRQKTAVLPVPDWLWTMTSLPVMIGTMDLCWTAEGLSKPESVKTYRSSRYLWSTLPWAPLTRKWDIPWVPLKSISCNCYRQSGCFYCCPSVLLIN